MPVYEYGCKKCDFIFEESFHVVDMEEPCKIPCPHCGGEIYIRLHPCGIELRGAMLRKPPSDFNDRLKEIKKRHPLGHVNVIE